MSTPKLLIIFLNRNSKNKVTVDSMLTTTIQRREAKRKPNAPCIWFSHQPFFFPPLGNSLRRAELKKKKGIMRCQAFLVAQTDQI